MTNKRSAVIKLVALLILAIFSGILLTIALTIFGVT